ncbi:MULTISPECIES: ABC transporter permease [Oscillospiraceae]|uniref:Iron export ABC transporter permease subunit FetB n=1 Tax=Lawsonibacter faecis TaxID=2763052 RepID=A0A8J6JDZ2_9FIRM|nr:MULTISPECIES: iron export ABC transporter permease subunit FetB [Oscillospiraceae]MTQ96757.1 iron export ABC transporter permease subunit FetB [Pseudoflavonifractor sp. BIOML-A16]MTR07419.1 iron export ABC transporter permease subunit FetB [Pseudoflavonifractor sp. BIOML-A15]MTR33086.1 iron export ABC transporter permease subunit FetB [Pseudoflavonifractor sp. BIOML-A14]MTR72166.1 iron export ABC transporter permease subunit FetB [Pseudoflavonifractor sp. BIOML-A18]MTS65538.1 iron export AB
MNNSSVMDLPILNLAIAYVFVLLLLLIFKARGIRRERQILIAATRMTIQLTVMGYILMFVFENPSWWLTLLMLAVMLSFAMYNAVKRVKVEMSKELKRLVCLSMAAGYTVTAAVFLFVVLRINPWFDPQYCIPISGMIVGNSMTGIALGANKLCSGMRERRELVENSLMLGATPAAAARGVVNDAFDSAILPTMNNMLTMGIVSLPGMMTGQILSGTFPLTAIKYQIGIMLAILGCTALTVVIFVTLGYKTFFTKYAALRDLEH